MTTMKTLTIAVLAATAWLGTSAFCLSQIATVPANLAAIDARRTAPAQVPAPLISVARANRAGSTPALRTEPRFSR